MQPDSAASSRRPYQPRSASPAITIQAEPTLTLPQVERLIETKMQQYKQPPPPPPMLRPAVQHEPSYAHHQSPVQRMLHPNPGQQVYQEHPYADYQAPLQAQLSPDVLPSGVLSSDALAVEMEVICAQLALPESPTYDQRMQSVRDFDKLPHHGGWHPRPPPTPLDPTDQAKLSREKQVRNEQTFRSRVRRAQKPHDRQKEDAWETSHRKTWEAAQKGPDVMLNLAQSAWVGLLAVFFLFLWLG